jgi:Uncharacterised nucleotidyltransferase
MTREGNHKEGPFVALLAAAAAIEQRWPEGLVAAFHSVSAHAMLQVAARHRCLGYLRQGIVELGVRDDRASAFTKAVREYAGKAAIQAYAVRDQLRQLVHTLNDAKIQFALLKGSARLFRGDRSADYDTMFDLDILVPREEAASAVEALERVGYHSGASADRSRHYWARHHHGVPLRPANAGLPVEVHVQLAPRGSLSLATDWPACQMYFARVVTAHGEATCLNALGSAYHLAVHGLGMRRLHDVLLLADLLRSGKDALEHIDAIVSQERYQAVALQAVIALAARVAGLTYAESAAVKRYLSWVIHRENLSPYVRDRSQFADAWFCNDCRVWGPAIRQALPIRAVAQSSVSFAVLFTYRLIGRIATSAFALASVATAARRP